MKKLNKSAVFTDIHWGARTNSELHNQDNLRYIDWFCHNVNQHGGIDNIFFLGDWFENRSAINTLTLKYASEGFTKIQNLKLPIFFLIGNHDLYQRFTRDTYSPIIYKNFDNVNIIDTPCIITNIGNDILMSPYLLEEEYPQLAKYLQLETWWGHFEFKGFQVTGNSGMKMPTGPDAANFYGPKHIFSGHFHKRQEEKNVNYIGNTFPTNFGDAGDNNRGMMIYDHIQQERTFIDWPDCPKYIKTELSSVLDGSVSLVPEARVQVLADIPISYEESTFIKKSFTDKYKLREFRLDESPDIQLIISETDGKNVLEGADKLASVDELVHLMLNEIESDHIDPIKLNEIYRNLKIDL